MSKKKCFYLLEGSVWPHDILICFGVNKNEILDYAKKRFENPFSDKDLTSLNDLSSYGKTITLSNRAILLWLSDFPTDSRGFGFMAHEIFHAADMVLYQAGMQLTDDSDEAWAYLIDWITKNIYQNIFKMK